MSNTKVLSYQENPITFGMGKDLWVNATEMAKPFNKQPKDFLRTQQAVDYCEALSRRLKCLPTDLLIVKNGGENNGTWMQQKLALRFAQWLSPDFSVWVDEKIEELLTTGSTSIPKDYPSALRALADSHEARMIAEAAAEQNKEKAEGYELLIEKADNYTLKEAADLLGSGQNRFSKWLMQNKFLQVGGIPYQTYLRNQPYFVVKEITKAGTVYHTPMVTPKGMDYFTKLRNRGQMNEILNKVSKILDTNIIKA